MQDEQKHHQRRSGHPLCGVSAFQHVQSTDEQHPLCSISAVLPNHCREEEQLGGQHQPEAQEKQRPWSASQQPGGSGTQPESWLTAAIPMDNPYCSCMLTRATPHSCNPYG